MEKFKKVEVIAITKQPLSTKFTVAMLDRDLKEIHETSPMTRYNAFLVASGWQRNCCHVPVRMSDGISLSVPEMEDKKRFRIF